MSKSREGSARKCPVHLHRFQTDVSYRPQPRTGGRPVAEPQTVYNGCLLQKTADRAACPR